MVSGADSGRSAGQPYKSLSELVHRQLRERILWGAVPPGSTLSVRKLSEQFGVSPMPVRDALRQLASEGLVEVTPRSSTRVTRISPETVAEISEIRSRLESLAARLALPHLTATDVGRLTYLLRAMDRAAAQNRPADWHRFNEAWHKLVFRRCGNGLLTRLTEDLWERNFRHFSGRVLSQAEFRRIRSKEHGRILQAILRRNPDAVEAAWRHHVHQSGLETVAYLRTLVTNEASPGGKVAAMPNRRRRRKRRGRTPSAAVP